MLTDTARTPYQQKAQLDLTVFAPSWFLSLDINTHLDSVQKRLAKEPISLQAFVSLYNICADRGVLGRAYDIGISYFGGSASYNEADQRFAGLIAPVIDDFSKAQLVDLVTAIENNSQILGRNRATSDHKLILTALNKAFSGSFKIAKFPNFMLSTA